MELLNELENDLALAFLVEKKHRTKIDSKTALALIEKVRKVLLPVSNQEKITNKIADAETCAKLSSH